MIDWMEIDYVRCNILLLDFETCTEVDIAYIDGEDIVHTAMTIQFYAERTEIESIFITGGTYSHQCLWDFSTSMPKIPEAGVDRDPVGSGSNLPSALALPSAHSQVYLLHMLT